MKKLIKIIVLIVLFFAFLIIFYPKEKFFNYALFNIQKEKIVLNNYKFKEQLFGFNLINTDILYDNINMANIKQSKINTYILFNKVTLKNIKLDDSLNQFLPSNINSAQVSYNVLNPLFIDINIYAKEFKIKGYFDIINQKIFLKFKMSKIIKRKYKKLINELKYDKQTKDYTYEYKL